MHRHFFLWIEVVQDGKKPLPHCDLCGMHMPEGFMIKRQSTQQCDRNTQMMWQRRDVIIARRCAEASFRLTGDNKAEFVEGVETFKYLVLMLDRSGENCPAVCQNVGEVSQL